jgi:hypothetical protein
MAGVLDAESLTQSPTQFEPPRLSSGWLANVIIQEGLRIRGREEGRQPVEPDFLFMVGPSKYIVMEVKSGGVTVIEDVASLASTFEEFEWPRFYRQFPRLGSTAESSTTTTERSRHQLQRVRRRNELLRRLTPERRATYERIKKLREKIGPLDFDVVEELRELREND